MIKRIIACVSVICMLTGCLASCKKEDKPSARNPVTITMWHSYSGGVLKNLNKLIDDFNNNIGKKKGITIKATAMSSDAELDEKLTAIESDAEKTAEMPDICTSYPKIARGLQKSGRLVNLDNYFSDKEEALYVDGFISEGRFEKSGLYLLPVAKSTEVLYLNRTLFDRFSTETGVKLSSLSTFEGIADLSRQYYEWTDAKTPDVNGDGKQFFCTESWFDAAQTAGNQTNESIFENGKISYTSTILNHIFDTVYEPFINGGFLCNIASAVDLYKSGDVICAIGSSSDAMLFGDTVTYQDGTSEKVDFEVLPYPTWLNGKKLTVQRGRGLMVAKSDPKKEFAAAEFIKWLTKPAQNMRLTLPNSYFPVTKVCFESEIETKLDTLKNPQLISLIVTVTQMYKSYIFYTVSDFDGYRVLKSRFEENFRSVFTENRELFLQHKEKTREKILEEFSEKLSGEDIYRKEQ